MSRDKENMDGLTRREKELAAIGAAIASNCVPCIEYHIPLARKLGLGDSKIREAIELADKVRRVPADKVLQTAYALLEVNNTAGSDMKNVPCGCPDREAALKENAGCGESTQNEEQVHLDHQSSEEDNGTKSTSYNERADDSTIACGSEKAEETQQNSDVKRGVDCSKMIQMMGECCPEKKKEFASMVANFMSRSRPSEEDHSSEEFPETKTES
jgi:4-carboxymuconolactone decarboxylase